MLDLARALPRARSSTRCATRSARGIADRRPRAELRRGLPRRAAEPASRTTRTRSGSPGRRSISPSSSHEHATATRRLRSGAGAGARPLPPARPMRFEPEHELLEAIGLDRRSARDRLLRHGRRVRVTRREHYDVSRACAERVLLPAVRDAAPETLIVATASLAAADRAARPGRRRAAPRRGARRSSHRPSRPRPTPARRCRTLLKLGPPSTLRASPEISSRPRPDRLGRAPRAPRPPRP